MRFILYGLVNDFRETEIVKLNSVGRRYNFGFRDFASRRRIIANLRRYNDGVKKNLCFEERERTLFEEITGKHYA